MGPLEGISKTPGWWPEQRHSTRLGWVSGAGLWEVHLRHVREPRPQDEDCPFLQPQPLEVRCLSVVLGSPLAK